jgi:large subunit ribosomal protein L35
MPKMKTHSGAKKRFSLTGTGKVKFKRAKMRHILTKKNRKWKRQQRKNATLCEADRQIALRLLAKK